MLPDMDVMSCRDLAVPMDVMQHVVNVESSFNRYAIGVVGGRLVRQPANLAEAVATARMLQSRGFNFSVGLAQVNLHNLPKYGLSLEQAFQACPNLQAGAQILADCLARSGNDWGKSLSCYYSGNFVTGFRHGYVQKVFASMRRSSPPSVRQFATYMDAGRAGVHLRPATANGSSPRVARRMESDAAQAGTRWPMRSAAIRDARASPDVAVISAKAASAPSQVPASGASAHFDQAFVF